MPNQIPPVGTTVVLVPSSAPPLPGAITVALPPEQSVAGMTPVVLPPGTLPPTGATTTVVTTTTTTTPSGSQINNIIPIASLRIAVRLGEPWNEFERHMIRSLQDIWNREAWERYRILWPFDLMAALLAEIRQSSAVKKMEEFEVLIIRLVETLNERMVSDITAKIRRECDEHRSSGGSTPNSSGFDGFGSNFSKPDEARKPPNGGFGPNPSGFGGFGGFGSNFSKPDEARKPPNDEDNHIGADIGEAPPTAAAVSGKVKGQLTEWAHHRAHSHHHRLTHADEVAASHSSNSHVRFEGKFMLNSERVANGHRPIGAEVDGGEGPSEAEIEAALKELEALAASPTEQDPLLEKPGVEREVYIKERNRLFLSETLGVGGGRSFESLPAWDERYEHRLDRALDTLYTRYLKAEK